ncbi:MAG: hypothetical protein JO125_03555 [Chloroflexi bacterium]|nr:hypothetical protein [Ktedonobacteraceae bacterium]MBV9021457.1 hypothetical protein [Ktedonobacteraceae bacterium]MBV9706467.1 hypothetical protein [Chloroflexota bacterium]
MSETGQEQQQSDARTFPLDWRFPEDVQITSLKITGSFPDGKRLARPLEVKVAYDDGEVVVSEPLFHIHGVGPTLPQALVAFKRILAEELDELTADEEELGPRLQAELHYLRNLMQMAE